MHILYIYPEFTIKGGADKVIIEKANYLASFHPSAMTAHTPTSGFHLFLSQKHQDGDHY